MKALKTIAAHLPSTPVLCLILALVGALLVGPHAIQAEAETLPHPTFHELQADDIVHPAKKVLPVSAEPETLTSDYDIPSEATSFKAWMPYAAITCKSSKQWELQQDAWTDKDGFRRYGDDGLYMVALGTYYAEECGKVFDITFESGTTIRCIVGDIKADCHTDELHQHRNGNVVEFIVDGKAISKTCKRMGDMSYAEGVNLKGKPIQIEEVNI